MTDQRGTEQNGCQMQRRYANETFENQRQHKQDWCKLVRVDDRATNSTAIEAIQTLLRVLCYLPAGSNEAIRGLCKTLAGLLLASAQQFETLATHVA